MFIFVRACCVNCAYHIAFINGKSKNCFVSVACNVSTVKFDAIHVNMHVSTVPTVSVRVSKYKRKIFSSANIDMHRRYQCWKVLTLISTKHIVRRNFHFFLSFSRLPNLCRFNNFCFSLRTQNVNFFCISKYECSRHCKNQ